MADGARAAAAAAVADLDLRRQVADMQRDLKELREKVCVPPHCTRGSHSALHWRGGSTFWTPGCEAKDA